MRRLTKLERSIRAPYEQRQSIPELDKYNKDSYKTIYLYHPILGRPDSILCDVNAFTVVASSPQVANYISITDHCPFTYYVYPWTVAELKALVSLISRDPAWWAARKDFLDQVGYSIRSLFTLPRLSRISQVL